MGTFRRLPAAALAALATPASAQVLATGSAPEVSVVRVLAALAICFAAAFALTLAWRSRRSERGGMLARILAFSPQAGSRIEIVEARRISASADICMIRIDGSEYLIVVGPGGLQLVTLTADGTTRDAAR